VLGAMVWLVGVAGCGRVSVLPRGVGGDDVEVTAEDAWMPRLDPLKCSDSCGNGTKELGTVSWPLPPIVTLSAAWPPSWRR